MIRMVCRQNFSPGECVAGLERITQPGVEAPQRREPAYEDWAEQRCGLDDVAAHGPAEQIDLRQAERIDELEQPLGQTVDRRRRGVGGPPGKVVIAFPSPARQPFSARAELHRAPGLTSTA